MNVVEIVAAALVLATTVALGTVAHELAHALALYALGIPYDVTWLPDGGSGPLATGITGRWAAVTPRRDADALSARGLRIAAMMPLALASPLALVLAGVVPDPTAAGTLPTAATVGWLACALPSPQDFSLLFHAAEALN